LAHLLKSWQIKYLKTCV